MAHGSPIPHDVAPRYLPRSGSASLLAGTFFLVGLVAFVVRLTQDPQAAWASYVANWLFFTSISIGGVLLAVVTWITKARWNWSIRRVSQSFVAFLPIAFVLLLPMLGLGGSYFPWVEEMAHDPVLQNKAAYLNLPFLISRNLVGVAVLFGLSLYFVYLALRPDMGLVADASDPDPRHRIWRERLTQGWMGQEQEEVDSYQRMTRIAPPFVLVYALVMTILVYDWAMTLEPHWGSTMFGPWFFMGAFLGGITATALWSLYLRTQHKDFQHWIGLQQRHDLGKLAFAFTVFWTYLFFAQYIVIWYGKLPWEQAWIINRSVPPWGGISALVVVLVFVIPFAGLIGRRPKMRPPLLATFAAVSLVGLWLERYVLIAPVFHHEGQPALPLWHPLIGLMFLGLWIWAIRWFFSTFPAIQIWQPMADPEALEIENRAAPAHASTPHVPPRGV
jgi:hypothetical protein